MSNPLKPTTQVFQPRKPRYEVRPRNGTYQVFDMYHYTAVESRVYEGDAIALCKAFNEHDQQQRRQP